MIIPLNWQFLNKKKEKTMSVNSRYGYTNKTVERFGETFSSIDFDLKDIEEEVFNRLKKKTTCGTFYIGNHSYDLNIHELERIIETCEVAKETVLKKYRLGMLR